jgi:glycine cleavage system H protein
VNLPEDRKYTENSLWLKKEGGNYKVGLVEPSAEKAEEFLFIELPEKGEKFEEGEILIEYEAMKRVGELKTPGDAEIVDVNREMVENPGKIVEDPYEAWLVKIRPRESFEGKLLTENDAKRYYEKEI